MSNIQQDVLNVFRTVAVPILLGIIGFFLKDLHGKIGEIEKSLKVLEVSSSGVDVRIEEMQRRLNGLERRTDYLMEFIPKR